MFDAVRARKANKFFTKVLRHTKGQFAGRPFDLMPWQGSVVAEIFGNVDAQGLRQIRDVYLEIAKKNGKTTFAAGLALLALVADSEPQAEVYAAATNLEQSAIAFRAAASMVNASPVLQQYLRVQPSLKRIVKRSDPFSFFRAISADGDAHDGIEPSCVIYDELHRWRERKALELYEILHRGSIARRQPLHIEITTAGVQDESPLCFRRHQYAKAVIAGAIENPRFFARIYGLEDGDDWQNPEHWEKANPSLRKFGGYLDLARLQEMYQEALSDGSKQQEFRRYHLNEWGQRDTAWMPQDVWARCNEETRPLVDRKCYVGVDLSYRTDLTACVFVFPDTDGTYDVKPFFWMPENSVRRLELRDKVPYSQWVRDGFITAVPGDAIHNDVVADKIKWASTVFSVEEIAYDPYGAHELSKALVDAGFACFRCSQTFGGMSEPSKKLMELSLEGRLRHAGHPVLAWNAFCVSMKADDNGNIRPSKPDRTKSEKRIDGMVASIMALDRTIRREGESGSVYDERGLLVI